MPYVDGKWVHNRMVESLGDPYKVEAERFVRNVETYLYDTDSPGYANPAFLAWCIAQYDASKTGSGRPLDSLDFFTHGDQSYLHPVPSPEDRVSPSAQADLHTRMPDEAYEAGYAAPEGGDA